MIVAPPSDSELDETGSVVAGYELVLRLAHDDLGSQYLARAKQTGSTRIVLMDRFRSDLPDHDTFSEQLLEDTGAVSKLRQLNLVTPVAFGNERGPYIVTEAIEALSLRELCETAASEPLPAAVAVRIAIDVLAGLNAMHHQRGADGKPNEITHGALSPAAIVLASDGSARVTQLGSGNARADLRSSDAHSAGVEVPYLAPELLDGSPVVRASDIFAIAAILWELLAGRSPFGSAAQASSRDRSVPIAAPSSVVKDLPDKLDIALARALESDPRKRFATVVEFSRAIETAGVPAAPRTAVAMLVARILREKLAQRREQVRQARLTATVAKTAIRSAPVPVASLSEPSERSDASSGAPIKIPTPVAVPMPAPAAAVPPETTMQLALADVVFMNNEPPPDERTMPVSLADILDVPSALIPVAVIESAGALVPPVEASDTKTKAPLDVPSADAGDAVLGTASVRTSVIPKSRPVEISAGPLPDDRGPILHDRAAIARLLEESAPGPSVEPAVAAARTPSTRPAVASTDDLEAMQGAILPRSSRKGLIAGLAAAVVALIVGLVVSLAGGPSARRESAATSVPITQSALVEQRALPATAAADSPPPSPDPTTAPAAPAVAAMPIPVRLIADAAVPRSAVARSASTSPRARPAPHPVRRRDEFHPNEL